MRHPATAVLLAAALGMPAGSAWAQNLFWVDTNYGAPTLNRSDPDGLSVTGVPLAAGTLPEGVAAEANGKLYWTEASWSSARVNRVGYDFSQVTPIVSGGSAFRGIAVNDQTQLLYWTSSNLVSGAFVHRASVTGAGATQLIALPAGANPRGIAVDPLGGKLYWADFDLNAIYQANLDGSGTIVWMTTPAGAAPYGVAVDPIHQLVYWTEYAGSRLQRATTAGTDVVTLIGGIGTPTYVAVDPSLQRIYWMDASVGPKKLRRINSDGTGLVTLPPVPVAYGGLAFSAASTTPVVEPGLPLEFALDLWPTPARGPVRIRYALPRAGPIRLSVLDLQGRQVASLAEGFAAAGRHEIAWRDGSARPAGLYFVRLSAGGRSWTRRLILSR